MEPNKKDCKSCLVVFVQRKGVTTCHHEFLLLLPGIDTTDPALRLDIAPGPLGWTVLMVAVPGLAVLTAWLAARGAVRVTLKKMS